MKPSEVSAQINIAPTTVRLWSNQFGQFLSASGAGGGGRMRDFTDHDLRVLALVKSMKSQGQTADEIHIALTRMQANGWIALPPLPPAPVNVASVPMMPTAAADAALDTERRALLREIASLENRVDDLARQLADEQAARRSDLRELMQQVADLRAQLAEAQALNRLYEAGRLKPNG